MRRIQGLLASSIIAAAGALCCDPAGAQSFTPIKPPAVPLVTREPYLNVWLRTNTAQAPGVWPAHWNGAVKAITGIVLIDGQPFLFLGAPSTPKITRQMVQTSLVTTATQSKFTFTGGGVELDVDFLSPVEAKDLRRLSMPLSDIVTSARSSDGIAHKVEVYYDISGEWAHGDPTQLIRWAPETINRDADGSSRKGTLSAWTVTPNSPTVFQQVNDYPSWGTVLFATETTKALTTQSGADADVRTQFVSYGKLTGGNDGVQPRAINDRYPVFAFSNDFGSVGSTPTASFTALIGHVRDPAINFVGNGIPSLWRQYWPAYESMLAFAFNDAAAALKRADKLDAAIDKASSAVGGAHYSALTALSLRQAFAATELTGTSTDDPYLFLEEISSDDNVSTVDVMYPSMPAFLYMNPELVKYLLAPVISYSESGLWPQLFAPHDLGSTYPNATGHNDGGGENMPVEETANMLIMADAYMQHVGKADAAVYANDHYALFKQWATYLLTIPAGVRYPNALDPQFQNQTDDFTGPIAHSVNLALKGIEAVGAMGQIAKYAGNTRDAKYFRQQAEQLISSWVQLSQNSTGSHLLLQYKEPANPYSGDTTGEPDSYWSLKYNAYPDKLLGLNLLPQSILTEEADFYKTQEHPTGIQLDPRTIDNPPHTFTKADWELWTAASTNDPTLAQNIIDEVYTYANTTMSGVPFPDYYDPNSSFNAFTARPVVGGLFAPLTVATPAK
ncbi:glutaminase domain-containing protein [Rhizosaccharibacter radicis]|uniref:DUF5127 domain-containing protein n=1 Tax=Rhizosaccharibacter radicis TaxID=2782605 RepID=A0ABT1VUY2_9PROT|nr:DUF5127 domain-containing protein [Acetobacteraceae bacterium KSS12]